jgi:hypothetical protein
LGFIFDQEFAERRTVCRRFFVLDCWFVDSEEDFATLFDLDFNFVFF